MFLGDAKYKHVDEEGVKNADLYQLLAYATAANLDYGLLVYAKGGMTPIIHTVRNAGVELEVTSLDLSKKPQEILDDVGRIANVISGKALVST